MPRNNPMQKKRSFILPLLIGACVLMLGMPAPVQARRSAEVCAKDCEQLVKNCNKACKKGPKEHWDKQHNPKNTLKRCKAMCNGLLGKCQKRCKKRNTEK